MPVVFTQRLVGLLSPSRAAGSVCRWRLFEQLLGIPWPVHLSRDANFAGRTVRGRETEPAQRCDQRQDSESLHRHQMLREAPGRKWRSRHAMAVAQLPNVV